MAAILRLKDYARPAESGILGNYLVANHSVRVMEVNTDRETGE